MEDTTLYFVIDTMRAETKTKIIREINEWGSELADTYQKYLSEIKAAYYTAILGNLRGKLKNNQKIDSLAKLRINQLVDSIAGEVTILQKAWIDDYIEKNPSAVAAVFIFNEYYSPGHESLSYLEATLKKFVGAAQSSVYYKELVAKAESLKKTLQGASAPDFTLIKDEGTLFSLSSARGKYILLDFWASWCIPCRKAIPEWKKIYKKYKSKDFTIISISMDIDWQDWQTALKKEKMSWVQLIDKTDKTKQVAGIADLYPHGTIPHYVLIGKDNTILFTTGETDEMIKRVNELFKE